MEIDLTTTYLISVVGGVVAGLIVKGSDPLKIFLGGAGIISFYLISRGFFESGFLSGIMFILFISLIVILIAYLIKLKNK